LPTAAAVVPADGMPVAPLDPEPELTTQPPDTPTVAREEHAADAAEPPAAETEAVKPA
jgi:hypothetical protein